MTPKGQQDDPLVSTHIHTYACMYVCACYVHTQKLKCELLLCYVTLCN